jgi:5-deoxy-5-amino-3-dehydroquinate synthase
MITVQVSLGPRSYPVIIGPCAIGRLAETVPAGVRRAVVVTQERIGLEVDPGVPHTVLFVPDGEEAKSLSNLDALCRDFARSSLSRSDLVVGVGGGVVTDLAGFAAAVYLRGVPFLNVSTTLLGQVDAAIGGKTGVNLPEGKNLVGAFWQPSAVICDTDTLATLDPREISSGRGEMAKYAFLGDDPPGTSILALPIEDQVAGCVRFKALVVSEDETESGRRAVLNYGHTLGHALEAVSFGTHSDDPGWDLRHGEAVAIGLVFAAELALRLGRIDEKRLRLHREVVTGFGLSSEIPPGASASELVGIMARDKKAHGDLTFVLDGPEGVELVPGVEPAEVTATLVSMGCEP